MFSDRSAFKRSRAQTATDCYEWGLLRDFKNVKFVTPEIKHKPFFEGFLIHTPRSYPVLILNVLLVFILLSHPLIQHWDMVRPCPTLKSFPSSIFQTP